jgi:hypothetical protein
LDIDESKIAKLKTPQEVIAFHNRYSPDGHQLDWNKAAKDFAGMEVSPYRPYGLGRVLQWHSKLSIPSGVVWNLKDALRSVKRFPISRLRELTK